MDLYETLIDLGGGVKEQLDQMILFDYLINNTDRHRKNFGFSNRNQVNFEWHLYTIMEYLLSQLLENT